MSSEQTVQSQITLFFRTCAFLSYSEHISLGVLNRNLSNYRIRIISIQWLYIYSYFGTLLYNCWKHVPRNMFPQCIFQKVWHLTKLHSKACFDVFFLSNFRNLSGNEWTQFQLHTKLSHCYKFLSLFDWFCNSSMLTTKHAKICWTSLQMNCIMGESVSSA